MKRKVTAKIWLDDCDHPACEWAYTVWVDGKFDTGGTLDISSDSPTTDEKLIAALRRKLLVDADITVD